MTGATYVAPQADRRRAISHQLRVLRVIASVDFKLKYADSAMGYVWSILKPLSYFGVLWIVFGRVFKFGVGIDRFPLYLITGIVLYTFFVDSTGLTFPSLVKGSTILRKIAFPPLVIPLSATLTACMTFCINLLAVLVFIVGSELLPTVEWLAIVPLLLELIAFCLGLGLILATLYVRFRDIAQIWELGTQLLIFASPIMYPITILPSWAQKAAYMNPLVQVMQDIRAVMLGTRQANETAASALAGYGGRAIPIGIALATLLVGLLLFRRESPRFAERV
jgi:ABC-2 type transport system permease protein